MSGEPWGEGPGTSELLLVDWQALQSLAKDLQIPVTISIPLDLLLHSGAYSVQIMAIRSRKFQDFVSEPMGDKPIIVVDGINEELGAKLAAKGFDKAYILLGQFLLLKKECDIFQKWLKLSYGASSYQAERCALCLLEWCLTFL